MVEGKYNLILKTPRGNERGSLMIIQQGSTIMGYLTYNGTNYKFSRGRTEEYNFDFEGEFKWHFMKIPYRAMGQVIRDKLSGTVYTRFGEFPVEGTKV